MPTVMDPGEKVLSKAAWFTIFRPWIIAVFGAACFMLSVCQTLSLLAKFLRGPLSTAVTLQEVDASHTPWITICPKPAVDFLHLHKLEEMSQVQLLSHLGGQDMPLSVLGILLEDVCKGNLTQLDEIVNEVFFPLTKQDLICEARPIQPRARSHMLCELQGTGQETKTWSSLKGPVITNTSSGSVETEIRIVRGGDLMIPWAWLAPCTTIKPNISFHPLFTEKVTITFGYNVGKQMENISKTAGVDGLGNPPHQYLWPQYQFYIKQPYETIDVYNFEDVLGHDGSNRFYLGETVDIDLSVEQFKIISSRDESRPCTDDPDVFRENTRCRRECVEQDFLTTKACRVTGPQPTSAPPGGNIPDATTGTGGVNSSVPAAVDGERRCNTSDEIWSLTRSLHTGVQALNMSEFCRKKCLRSCTRINYDARLTRPKTFLNYSSGKYQFPTFDQAGYQQSVLNLRMTTKIARVTEQEYSYGIYEFFSEIGGSWGLFLGASLVTVGSCFEQIILRLLH